MVSIGGELRKVKIQVEALASRFDKGHVLVFGLNQVNNRVDCFRGSG